MEKKISCHHFETCVVNWKLLEAHEPVLSTNTVLNKLSIEGVLIFSLCEKQQKYT